jgi:hypothetical protein
MVAMFSTGHLGAVTTNQPRFALVLLALIVTGSVAAEPAQLSPEKSRIIESARVAALEYTHQLPDFICTQITHRAIAKTAENGFSGTGVSGRGPIAAMANSMGFTADTIEEQLTYVGGKESYEVLSLNGRKAVNKEHMSLTGVISAGEFGSLLSEVFDPAWHTTFTWVHAEKFHGRPVDVFRFNVPKEAGTSIFYRDSDKEIQVSYSGEIYLDPETMQIVEIVSKFDLPPTFPIHVAERRVEYAPQQIAGKSYSLPTRSHVHMEDGIHSYDNQIDFKNYHRFSSESTLHFDDNGQSK